MNAPSNLTQEHVRAMLRNDFAFFSRGTFRTLLPSTTILWNWHLDLMANRLEDVLQGRCRNLIINIPPRYGKSLIASIAFPAFILGHDPTAEVVCVSYGQDLSEHTAINTRRLMTSPMFEDAFATWLVSRRAKLSELRTTDGGTRLATSVDGMLTGRGGNFLIIDDPLKPSEALSPTQREAVNRWYDNTTITRSNDKENGAKIVIMQRLNEDDLVGHLQRQGNWELLSLPGIAESDERHQIRTISGTKFIERSEGKALHPERESLARIQEVREAMGPYTFAAQYQQRPAPEGGAIVKPEWFPRFDLSNQPDFDSVFQSWDTASKGSELSDYSVCTTWGKKGRQFFLLHVLRKRLEYPDLKRAVIEQARLWNARKVLVEDASSGQALIQDLKNDRFYLVEAVKPKGDKIMRLNGVTGVIENGQVFVPSQAAWLDDYLHELMMFPAGRYDDQVDSTSQALSNALIFRSPGSGWLEMMDEALRRTEQEHIPSIRYNCDDKSMTFLLYGGRKAEREADGSFLVTPEEAKYMAANCYRVE